MLYVAQGAQVDSTNGFGQTPLHIAAGAGNLLCSVFFVLNTTNVDAKDSMAKTPLDYCKENKHANIEAWLIKRGATSNPTKEDFNLESQFWVRPNDLRDLKRASIRRVEKILPPSPVKKEFEVKKKKGQFLL